MSGATEAERPRRGALLVGAGILASRIAGLGRQAVVGAAFGVGPHADVFATALRAPNLLQNLLGEQALSASFIPVYSRLLAAGRHEAARRFAGAVFGLLVALVAALSLAGVLAARPLVALFAAGYLQDAARVAAGELDVDRFELAVRAVRWIFPMTGLLVLSAWALGVLNSHGRFFLSYVAPVVWNAAIVAALLWGLWGSWGVRGLAGLDGGAAGPGLDRLVILACGGALAGGLLQFLVQLGPVLRELRGLPVSWRLETEGVREALRAFGPAVAGRGAVQLSSYLDLFLASLLAAGAVSALGYAQLLYLLPVSLFGQSVAAAALPELSRASAGAEELARRSRTALGRVGLLVVPTSVLYLAAGLPLVGALYGMLPGRFGEAEARLVAAVLGAYALGLPAATAARLLQSAFFALGDTRTPARVATARVVVGGALAVPLMLALDRSTLAALPGGGPPSGALDPLRLGAVGLALAASVAAWLEWAWLARALSRRLPGASWAAGDAARVLAASLAGGAAALLAQLPAGAGGWSAAIRLAAALGAFAFGFGAVGLALGLPYLREIPWIGRLGRGGRR